MSLQRADLPSGNGRVLPLLVEPPDAHNGHSASGQSAAVSQSSERHSQVGEMFLTRHVYPPRKVGVSTLLKISPQCVVLLENCKAGDDHSRPDPCLFGLGQRHCLLRGLLGLSSLQGNIPSWPNQ